MELVFIVNPNSGGERGFKVWKRLERRLEQKGCKYKAYITDDHGDATSIARRLTESTDHEPLTIVIVGGDGTVNEVINGLSISNRVTLGYIPTGSGNDLATGLRLSKNSFRCLERILKPKKIETIDYGVISYGDEGQLHRRFLVSSGIGYDASITQAVQSGQIKRCMSGIGLTKFSYTIEGIRQLIGMKTSPGYIIIDGTNRYEFGHIFFVSSHIHQYEGGGYRFAPKASNTDGKLTLCMVHAHSRTKLLSILLSSKMGNHLKYAGVRSIDCVEVTIHTDKPMAVHADGESCYMQQDISLRCIPGRLRFIVR